MSEPFDSLRSLRALDSPAFGWELAEGHERALRLAALAQDIRLACIWPKAMSEPAGRQASRMAGGGGFEPPLTGSEPVVLPLDDPPAGPSSIISDEG